MSTQSPPNFKQLGLPDTLLKALSGLGYETPSPIQAECIPLLLEGKDIIGQAQTGTGKTAAFALPLLSRVDVANLKPQILVLAPTRELAIQVAEAFQSYASKIKNFHVLPIYGGQSYDIQLRQLKRGVHVIVGTPGRVMDHLERKTLKLDQLQALVLDEADEMLRMGFIDDVEWILDKTPVQRQIALFSATMPPVIQKVANKYLSNPARVKIKSKTQTASTIRQSYLQVSGYKKIDALTRILESTDIDAVLIFVRTKNATVDLAEKLEARGYACEALNGDIAQKMRERTIDRLKKKKIDIVIATDVAARGLDVERISHVVNYDIPYDAESYVHRIGRTGRAGREGEAILFVTQKERHLLRSIEKMTQHKIEALELPSTEDINQQRMNKFRQRIQDTIDTQDLSICHELVHSFVAQKDTDPLLVAAALVKMVQGDEPLLLQDQPKRNNRESSHKPGATRGEFGRDNSQGAKAIHYHAKPLQKYPDIPMRRYRLEVGSNNDVKPGNIVGAVANEAEIDSCYIGAIDIYDEFTLIDLPDGMPGETFRILKKARVAGRPLNISAVKAEKKPHAGHRDGKDPKKSGTKPKLKHQKRKGKRPAVARRKEKSRARRAD
ncbi:MAG: DEAD/DEAH box helicase [Gammaproteobacteria bacterium]|nr:DEAD/DEAH box helicase [Gammaproteobacteria bacterium]